jgi:hypothetical protein
MIVADLIQLLANCNLDYPVKIFNIGRNMDILTIDPEPTRLDTTEWEEKPINEVWISIGFEAQ